MNFVGLTAVVLLFGGATIALLAFSPIGRALSARLLGRTTPILLDEDELKKELEQLRGQIAALGQRQGDLDGLREEVTELAERVDFAERLIAQQREAHRLTPGRSEG